jgi:class 3 adenylate cyclase
MSDGSMSGQPAYGGGLPTGTVTFLRTDVEGSMGLTRALGERWDDVNARHVALIREAVDAHRGTVVRTEGDAVFAAFPEAGAAVAAAVEAQRSLQAHAWPDDARLRVRMGIHSGEAHRAGDDYGGIDVSRAARVAAVGHGGQIILSGPAYELTADDLPEGAAARDLGLFVLKDIPRPERLYQLDVAGLPGEFPPVRAGRTMVGNLEPRLTTFIGRDEQVAALVALLDDARLVTVTGAGGIGKTSVATEAARAVEADFADGAWFVPLATIDDPADVKALVARTIGLFDGTVRSAVETLPAFLAERSMLLVLDNFEHVLDAAAAVAELVRVSPRSRFIVTSRAPLRVTGEHELPMAPLGVDGADGAARRLFVERANALQPGWDPGTETAIVDEICALVDGLPLGIEIAAARVSLLPLTAIRDRLAARLPLPGSGARDVPARQRTLEGAVAWSHDLLPLRLQRAFHRLSVFEDRLTSIRRVRSCATLTRPRRTIPSTTWPSSPARA